MLKKNHFSLRVDPRLPSALQGVQCAHNWFSNHHYLTGKKAVTLTMLRASHCVLRLCWPTVSEKCLLPEIDLFIFISPHSRTESELPAVMQTDIID